MNIERTLQLSGVQILVESKKGDKLKQKIQDDILAIKKIADTYQKGIVQKAIAADVVMEDSIESIVGAFDELIDALDEASWRIDYNEQTT